MDASAIKPGVTIIVPAGAAPARTHSYRLRVTDIYLPACESHSGYVHLAGEVQRMDGTPSRRGQWARDTGAFVPYRRYAILDPAKIHEATP